MPRKCGPGRPPKLDPAKTAFLAVVREYRRMDYRELAVSSYVRFLALRVHYTTIQKAIAKLPEWFLNEAARAFAELVSADEIESVADATEFSIPVYKEKWVGRHYTRVKRTVKLSALWDADKRVFHAFRCLDGDAHGSRTLLPMMREVRVRIRKCFADTEFCSRENVQELSDAGIEPVIKPHTRATTRSRGAPAWKRLIRRFKRLGYERWRDETGYGKRYENEGTFGALITRFGDAVRARNQQVAGRLIGARVVFHNFFASLVHG